MHASPDVKLRTMIQVSDSTSEEDSEMGMVHGCTEAHAEDAQDRLFHLSPDVAPQGLGHRQPAAWDEGWSGHRGSVARRSASLEDDDSKAQDLDSFLEGLKQKYGLLDLENSRSNDKSGWRTVGHPLASSTLQGSQQSVPAEQSWQLPAHSLVPLPAQLSPSSAAASLLAPHLPASTLHSPVLTHNTASLAATPASLQSEPEGRHPGCSPVLVLQEQPTSMQEVLEVDAAIRQQQQEQSAQPAGSVGRQDSCSSAETRQGAQSPTTSQPGVQLCASPVGTGPAIAKELLAEGPATEEEQIEEEAEALKQLLQQEELERQHMQLEALRQQQELELELELREDLADGNNSNSSSSSAPAEGSSNGGTPATSTSAGCDRYSQCDASGSCTAPSLIIPACGIPAHNPLVSLMWHELNAALVRTGFPPVLPCPGPGQSEPGSPDLAMVYRSLDALLGDHTRLRCHVQRLGQGLHGADRREAHAVASFKAVSRERDREVQKWKRLALENQQLVRGAQLASVASGKSSGALAAEVSQLTGQVEQLQHQLRAKESEAEKLKQHLSAQLAREDRRQRADRDALERLKRSWAAARAADAPTPAAAVVAAAVKELRPVDICRIFEAERANLKEELAVTRAEKEVMEAQLARAREALHAAGLATDGAELLEGQARAAARAAAAAEERAARAEEEAAALRAELGMRATPAAVESLRRQVVIMERQLQKAAAEKVAATAQANSNARSRPRQLGTRELIQRDRALQRLGLSTVDELPKPVLVETLQDVCLLLEQREPLKVCSAITPLQDLAALVPRMERWIGDVCAAVFRTGLPHVPEALRQDNPADVPAILAAWLHELGELLEARGVLRALSRQLAARAGLRPGMPPPTPNEVVPLVAQLVELEWAALHSKDVIKAAESTLAAQPELLINRIVLHFRQLFGCSSLEGVLPAMNRLFLAHNETQTFMANLRSALGLEAGTTLETCANRLQCLLDDRREVLAGMLTTRQPHVATGPVPEAQHAKVIEVAPRRRELQAAADTVIERLAERRNFPKVEIYVPQQQEEHDPAEPRQSV